jgi:hypothetical protein
VLGQEDDVVKVVKGFLPTLAAVVLSLVVPGCGPAKGPRVISILPSPILTTHRPPKKAVADCKPVTPVIPDYFATRPNLIAMGSVPAEWFPPVADNGWEVIVVHHSASDKGSARTFDIAHRARGWDELGYHFVIGNGTETPDGYIEVGNRWKKQKHGAHCKTPTNYYNEYGIGICLVGDFDQTNPTPAQMQSLRRLVAFLSQRYHVSRDHIYGHGEVQGTHTHCPGRYFPMNNLRNWIGYNTPIWASSAR